MNIRVEQTEIEGCLILKYEPFLDERGSFEELFHPQKFAELGLPTHFAQDNMSWSDARVLRGLHLQSRNPQGKLVRCLFGEVLDVCVDARVDSPTCGQHVSLKLSRKNDYAIYCPPGTAHGFFVLKGPALVSYKCTTLYDPLSDGGIDPGDPDLRLPWPEDVPATISEKDAHLPDFMEYMARRRSLL